MTRYACCVVVALALLVVSPRALASPFTPLRWQQPVERHANRALVGQRKHTTWVRDRNRNFIDDEIERRHRSGERVNVIVDLADCVPWEDIPKLLQPFGRIRYVGKVVTFVMLDQVGVDDLPKLAALPQVAMIEMQQNGQFMTDVSTRAIQARASATFSPSTAADRGQTGAGVRIAVLDSGVDDGHEQFTGKFVAGFDAVRYEDTNNNGIDDSCEPAPLGNGVCTDPDDEPANGTTHPVDDVSHGTHVAGIALGQGAANRTCSNPDDTSTPNTCAGVAPGAGLVSIKLGNNLGIASVDVAESLDWLALNARALGVRVANMSIGFCTDDDGTSAMPQQVNYLAGIGVVMVVAHGNAGNCSLTAGTVRTMYPGSASFAVTVGGTDDRNTVGRGDEAHYSGFLAGPRNDFNVASPDPLALKPDISAPGQNVFSAQFNTTTQYVSKGGTSMAAPHVAGAAALMVAAQPTMDPGSVKDLLRRSADTALNAPAYPAVDAAWDTGYGAGMLNIFGALSAAAATDVGFPTCSGAPANAGQPCPLANGLPSWSNVDDIDTAAPPQVGVANTLTADVRNFGTVPATVLVNFGVYAFAAGNNQFLHIGTQQVTIAAGTTVTVSQPWTPASSDHQCAQASIDYGFDTSFGNNVTQRNLSVAPSVFAVRVENPLSVPARIELAARSRRDGWTCKVSTPSFTLHPYRQCAKKVEVTFDAPATAKVGERADCEVGAFAVPERGKKERVAVGGVTAHTFVPRPCKMVGWIRDAGGRPVRGAVLAVGREKGEGARSDDDGIVTLVATPYRLEPIALTTAGGEESRTEARLYCGVGTFEVAVSKGRLEVITHRRGTDWAWDEQVREGYGRRQK